MTSTDSSVMADLSEKVNAVVPVNPLTGWKVISATRASPLNPNPGGPKNVASPSAG